MSQKERVIDWDTVMSGEWHGDAWHGDAFNTASVDGKYGLVVVDGLTMVGWLICE